MLVQATHVAVDRWTNEAADGFLFSAIEPIDIPWEPLRMTLRPGRRGPGALPVVDAQAEQARQRSLLALLLHLLRDLMRQRIPLGFGVNRGYGHIRVEAIHFDVRGECRADQANFAWLDKKVWSAPQWSDLKSPAELAALQFDWQRSFHPDAARPGTNS
jgi:hypothetical protein